MAEMATDLENLQQQYFHNEDMTELWLLEKKQIENHLP